MPVPTDSAPIAGMARYRVDRTGRVWSCVEKLDPNPKGPGDRFGPRHGIGETWHQLKYRRNRTGYLRVALYEGDRRVERMVHHLVLEAFVGPRPDGKNACHNNDNREDNRLENLRWDTPEANWSDRKRNGRADHPARGSGHGMAKLCEGDVRSIRERRERGETYTSIAKDYPSVGWGAIAQVCSRRSWKHVS